MLEPSGLSREATRLTRIWSSLNWGMTEKAVAVVVVVTLLLRHMFSMRVSGRGMSSEPSMMEQESSKPHDMETPMNFSWEPPS